MAEHQHDGHAHGHHHGERRDTAFAIGTALNVVFVIAEVILGLAANSMALLADAAHNLGDVLGLLLSWGAVWLTRLPPTTRRTYGWGRSSILAALANATILLMSVGAISVEAVQRLIVPQTVSELTVVLVAAAGIVVNGVTALMFMRGREGDLNIRAQFVHWGADAAVSICVVIAGLLIGFTGWFWLDPVTSLGVAVVIVVTTWGLLRESVDLAMDAVPTGVAPKAVQDYLVSLPGVTEVHDLHIWGLSTTETALTVHLVYENEPADRRLHELTDALSHRFGIGHATFQIESATDAERCRLRPHHVV